MAKKGRHVSNTSSSDTESSSTRPQPRPSPAKTKKLRPKLAPQQSIDSLWDAFSQKKFGKALAVLPFSPVLRSSLGEQPNELLSAGYERAAEECRRKVRKIIAECKRINTRYRDPGWDIDWDMKFQMGDCLNSLGDKRFDISESTMFDPDAKIPKAVKRVHEIYDKPTFMHHVFPGDVKQGQLGNCWFIASLTGLANVEDGIKRICVEHDTKIGIYGFVFYRDGEWIYSIIDDKLYLKSPCWDSPSMQRNLLQQIDREDVEHVYRKTYQTGSKALFFAQNKDQNETWVPLIEKAYAKAHGDYACLVGGWTGEALEDLSGGVTTELLASDILDTEEFWNNELSRVNQEFLFGCSTGLLDGGYGERGGIVEEHAYVIMEARTLKNGTRLLKLRNPWGKTHRGNWEGAWSDGSKEWTTDVQEELNHSFGIDSTFWISYKDLLRKYQHFDRTRLFNDPNWRCCQRWIGVEVPWKARYHETFHIKLRKQSPLVLVLSQLDERYFHGLQGQYCFRLQFRLHEHGSPDAEDYIVRSHGNYLMDRSVSVELPSMSAGSYIVFISVIGERDSEAPSVEDAVKRECKKRVENEKLVQVGHAYDLAHSKGAAHLEALAKLRKKNDSSKAMEARKAERRKKWEKRGLRRYIDKQQQKKNSAKIDRRKAREAEEKELREEKAAEEQRIKDDKAAGEKQLDAEKEAKEKRVKAVAESKKNDESQGKDKDGSAQASGQHDKSDDASTTSSSTPQDTPTSNSAVLSNESKGKIPVSVPVMYASNVSGEPPPAVTLMSDEKTKAADAILGLQPVAGSVMAAKPALPPAREELNGDSSDSPVEDWEALYSSDDMSHNPDMVPVPAKPAKEEKSDDEEPETPDPWNAIAIVGFRVYSMDESLELRVFLEGGNLEEGGMGEQGEADLDNAQSNAGGQRKKEQTREDEKGIDGHTFDQKVDETKTEHIEEQSKGAKGELESPDFERVDKPKGDSPKPAVEDGPDAKTDTSGENQDEVVATTPFVVAPAVQHADEKE